MPEGLIVLLWEGVVHPDTSWWAKGPPGTGQLRKTTVVDSPYSFLGSESRTPRSRGKRVCWGMRSTFTSFFLKEVTALSPCQLFLHCNGVKTGCQPHSWSFWLNQFGIQEFVFLPSLQVMSCSGLEPTLSEPLLKGARTDRTLDVLRDPINLDIYGKSPDF